MQMLNQWSNPFLESWDKTNNEDALFKTTILMTFVMLIQFSSNLSIIIRFSFPQQLNSMQLAGSVKLTSDNKMSKDEF